MKDLLSKEHYCSKIHTLLIKSKIYFPFYALPPLYRLLPFLPENLYPLPPSMIFHKSQTSLKLRRGSHCELDIVSNLFSQCKRCKLLV